MAVEGGRTFLSKAWSGSSMMEAAKLMRAVPVKQELSDDPDELQKQIEDSVRFAIQS